MGKKLYVGNLSWNTTNEGLRQAFERFGTITDATVITDRETGRSRGFGFVTFDQDGQASEAMNKMNGVALDGRNIRVNEAQEKSRGGGGGGGRGRRGDDDM